MLTAYIKHLSDSFLNEARCSPSLMADMAAMENYMSESYSGRIFVELLQNADDAGSSNVLLVENDNYFIFANDGRPFSEQDILAISRSGASTKNRGENIGYRGIGFKSTSFLSSEIIIISGSSCFTFSKSRTAKELNCETNCVPTIRIPFLCDYGTYESLIKKIKEDGYTTFFIFEKSNSDILYDELQSLDYNMLLFLRNVQNLQVNTPNTHFIHKVNRTTEYWGQNVIINDSCWGVFDNSVAVKKEDGIFVECNSAESNYYCFLPTLDKCPYNVIINADFSTDPSRKHLIVDNRTKSSITKIALTISSIIKDVFDSPNVTKKNLLKIFSGNNSFNVVSITLREELKKVLSNTFMLTLANGNSQNICNYKLISKEIEPSLAFILRKDSTWIKEQSLCTHVYTDIENVDDFIGLYSKQSLVIDDYIKALEEENFVKKLSEYLYANLLGFVLKSSVTNKYIHHIPMSTQNVKVKVNDEVKIICEINSEQLKDLISESKEINLITESDIECFAESNGISYLRKEDSSTSKKDNINNHGEKMSVMPVIPRWRSAENACLEIETFLGNAAKDVSKQNLGYDIESISPDGHKRYIEVKLIHNETDSFCITNNEYTAAHQYKDEYYVCLICQGGNASKAIYIKNPIDNLHFEKRIRQWEWLCENYQGTEITINY